jgi:hypothetical protein
MLKKWSKQGVVIYYRKFWENATVLDIKPKSGGVQECSKILWKFKQNTTEEIESITLDPDHAFLIVMNQITYGQQKGY